MDHTIELTLEQEFSIRSFSEQVGKMSHEQTQEFLILQHKHMMLREIMYQEILKQQWQLDMDLPAV